ncbi:MAG TPA: hypothetical protein VFP97_04375 [Chitinophagaceae bacterium]|nr:hypothetical protein [Chitinophagaceae bacterium]
MGFFSELKRRNALLFWFGLFNLAMGVICLALMPFEELAILGVNRWLKPFKFYASVGIMVLTTGWLMYYLDDQKKVRIYSWMIIFTMFFENGIIFAQSVRQTTSHFNYSSMLNNVLFGVMGVLIIVFTIVMIVICFAFFRQKQFSIPAAYLWGIRFGILFFIIFSLEGGMMIALMKHTVGGVDGGPGLPVVNWSNEHGDLRIAHFLGIHSLQFLPLFGYYISKTKTQTILVSTGYFLLCSALFLQAINGIPLFF